MAPPPLASLELTGSETQLSPAASPAALPTDARAIPSQFTAVGDCSSSDGSSAAAVPHSLGQPRTLSMMLAVVSIFAVGGILYAAIFTPIVLAREAREARTPPPPPPGAPPLRIVLITDWHTNPFYSQQVGVACQCNSFRAARRSDCLLAAPASPFGQMGCDAPEALGAASLEAAAAAVPDPDLVIVLGDLVMHGSPGEDLTQATFWNMSARIARAFPSRPRACTVPLGNNDVYPDYHINNSDTLYYATQARTARAFCGIDESVAALFARRGYYHVRIHLHKLRVLVLNTNIYAVYNCPTSHATRDMHGRPAVCGPDPLGQFAWLETQLSEAAAAGEFVHVHGHIVPGLDMFERTPMWAEDYASRWWQLVDAHATVIDGLFFGHWHSAVVRPTRSAAAAEAPALQALASISPIYGNNPVFYSASFPHHDYRLQPQGFTQHVLTLATAGRYPSFVATPRATPPNGLTNRDYLEWIATWLTPEGEAAFVGFYDQWKAGYHGKGLACNTSDADFQECAVCTGGCRVAFACLNSDGLTEAGYRACVARHL